MSTAVAAAPRTFSPPRRWNRWAAVLAPAVLFYIAFFVGPVLTMLLRSFSAGHQEAFPQASITLSQYGRVVSDEYYWRVLLRTFVIGLEVTLISIVIGYLLAYTIVRVIRRRGLRRLVYMLILAPLFTSAIVRAFGWLVILGRDGVVNQVLIRSGLTQHPVPLIFNTTGIVIGLTHILTPFMVLTVASVLQNIDPALEVASRDLGASPLRTFLHITLPLSVPGVVAGSLIVFTLTVSAYVAPSVLGGGRVVMLPSLVFDQYMTQFNWNFGAALAVFLLVPTFVLVWLVTRVFRPRYAERQLAQ